MKRAVVLGVALIVLAGCGKKDANETNFGKAIGQYLDQNGDLCLDMKKWPVDVTSMDIQLQKSMPTGTAGKMAALEAVGLAKGTDTEIDQIGTFTNKPTGNKFKVKRYVLTEAAKPFEKQREHEYIGVNGTVKETLTDICWGKKSLDKVVKWEGPIVLGDYQEAKVNYLYKIDNLADWAKKPEFQTAFPSVGSTIDNANKKEVSHAVKLTSEGWEAKGLKN